MRWQLAEFWPGNSFRKLSMGMCLLSLLACPVEGIAKEFGKWSLGTDLSFRRDFGASWSAEIEPMLQITDDKDSPSRMFGARLDFQRLVSSSGPLRLKLHLWGTGQRFRRRVAVRFDDPSPLIGGDYVLETRDIQSWYLQAGLGLLLEARLPWLHGVTFSMAVGQVAGAYREDPESIVVGNGFQYETVPSLDDWPKQITRTWRFQSGGFPTALTARLHF